MEESNVLKRYLDAGVAFTQLTQSRAEALVKDLVKSGEVQTEQTQATVAELVERSRKNTERFFEQVRNEVRDQVANLGVATRADLKRVERNIDRLERQITALRGSPATAGRAAKAAPKKAAAKKAPAKTAGAKKRPAKKSAS